NEISVNNADKNKTAAEKSAANSSIQAELDQLNLELANNKYGQWAYVLLAIVFALAGALCLSISFPALEGHTKKTMIRINIWRNINDEKKMEKIYLSILLVLTDLKSMVEQARTTLNCLPALETLETKVQDLKDQIQEQVEKYRTINTDTLTATYNDAFEEALAHEVEGKPTIFWKEVPGLKEEQKSQSVPQVNSDTNGASENWINRFFGSKNQAPQEQKPIYVHQKLRKLIQERRLN
ncbi:MAG: hypothetical protein LPK21_01705, partial [Hymenobacteraceae bacterium]|nr:hypothetical protein [Hymenobacteraceae bacterium]